MQLGDVCGIRSGVTLRERLNEHRHGGTLTVQQGDLSPRGEFNRDGALRVAVPASSLHFIDTGEVVFRSRGPYWSAWAPTDFGEPLLAVAPLFILHPAPDIDAAYLAWLLGRPAAQRYFVSEAMGTGVKMIPKAVLQRLPVQFPSLHVQRSITRAAEFVDQERALSARLADLRFKLHSTQLDRSARHAAETSATDRKIR